MNSAPISAIISALELIPNMEEQRTRLIQQAEQSSYRLLNLTYNLTDAVSYTHLTLPTILRV